MSDLERWRSSILRGAGELLARHSRQPLPPDRAYRLLVWLGRAEQLPERGAGLEALRASTAGDALVPALLARVELPAPEELFSTLEELLASGADPETELHCALLDVDDLLTVLDLVGREAEAGQVGREAVVRVERWPWKAGPLRGWADGRLKTLPPRSAAASLWRAVERGSRYQVLPEVSFLRRASRGDDTPFEPISGPGFELFESDEGRLTLWVELPPGKGQPQRAVLRMWSGERSGSWSYALAHADLAERAAYFDLGSREELRQRAAEAAGELPGTAEAFTLTVELLFDDDPTVSS